MGTSYPAPAAQPGRIGQLGAVRVREDLLFTDDKQRESGSLRKRAEKLVSRLEAPLSKLLQPDEAVLYIAPIKAPASFFEQWTLGWYIYRVTRSVFVFTNHRIFHFLLHSNDTWRRMVRSVSYGDISEARSKGWLNPVLLLNYKNGEKEKYWGIERRDARKMRSLLADLMPAAASRLTARAGIVSLCPDCSAELTAGVYTCARCGLRFKDEQTMVRRALLIPGGGYFYTGYGLLGVGAFAVEAVFTVFLIVALLELAGVLAPAPGEERAGIVLVAFPAGILAVEKLLTIHHCRRFVRGFIPAQ